MHCKVKWNHNYIRSTFPSSWLSKDYKNIREKILFDTELAKIPDSQRFCDAWLNVEKIERRLAEKTERLKQTRHSLSETRYEYEQCNQDIWLLHENENEQQTVDPESESLKEKSHLLHLQIRKLSDDVKSLTDSIESDENDVRRYNNTVQGCETNDEHSRGTGFYLACPKDDCRGFVDRRYTCGLCHSVLCSQCNEIKQEDGNETSTNHRCDPDTKASVDVLKNDSKPCPKCGSLIYRISGCDQMWCTQCRTAFSWNTRKMENGIIHNPHFYEYMRQRRIAENGRYDQRCRRGRYITENSTYLIVRKIRELTTDLSKRNIVMNVVRLLIRLSDVELPNLVPLHVRNIPHDPNRDIRIRYMLNRMTIEEFRTLLQKREKDRLKREEVSQVLETFVQVADDLVYDLLNDVVDDTLDHVADVADVADVDVSLEIRQTNLDGFLSQMEHLRNYINDALAKIAQQYHSKRKAISPTYDEELVVH